MNKIYSLLLLVFAISVHGQKINEIIFFQKKPAAFQAPFAELLQRTERMGVLHFLIQQMKLSHSEVFILPYQRECAVPCKIAGPAFLLVTESG